MSEQPETETISTNSETQDETISTSSSPIENEPIITPETQQKIDLSYSLKKEGDSLLKNQNYDEALKNYTKAVITVKHLIKDKLIPKDSALKLKNEVLIPSNLNMSMIDLKIKDYDSAIRHCNKVLFIEKNHVKALYRRCTAYIYKGNFTKADEDLIELEELIGGNKELEQLEELFEVNKRNAEGNHGAFLKKMAQNIKGKNIFHDKNNKDIKQNKDNTIENYNYITKIKNIVQKFKEYLCCNRKKQPSMDKTLLEKDNKKQK